MLLSELKADDKCIIEELACDGVLKQRMMVMGIVPGVEVSIVKYAPLGDPIEVKINSANLSLRKQEANAVIVKKI